LKRVVSGQHSPGFGIQSSSIPGSIASLVTGYGGKNATVVEAKLAIEEENLARCRPYLPVVYSLGDF